MSKAVTVTFAPISILAVLADRDIGQLGKEMALAQFQSSQSLRTATPDVDGLARLHVISILAVLADRDRPLRWSDCGHRDISILAVLADRDAWKSQDQSAQR